jgi:hypothetical protein
MSLFHINLSAHGAPAPTEPPALVPVPEDCAVDPLLAAIVDAGRSCQAEAKQLWACDSARLKATRACDRDAVRAARAYVKLEDTSSVSTGMLKMVEILTALSLSTKAEWANLGVVRGPSSGRARDAGRTTDALCTAHLCEFPGSFWLAALFCASGMRVNWIMNSLHPRAVGATVDPHGFLRTAKSRRRCVADPDEGDILSAGVRAALQQRGAECWGERSAAGLVTADGFPNRASAGLRGLPKEEQEAYYARQGEFMLHIVRAETCAALPLLAPCGVFVLKALDVFAWEFIAFLERLRLCFVEAHLIKPVLSSPENSEVYFVGVGFLARQADYDWAAAWTTDAKSVPQSMLRRPGAPLDAPAWAGQLLRLHSKQISAMKAHRARAGDPDAGVAPYPLPGCLAGWLEGIAPALRARPADAVDAPRKMLANRRPYHPGDKKFAKPRRGREKRD